MRQPAAAPLDHFCILFLREKDGGEPPQPSRAVAQWVTWSRETRRCCRQNSRARFADRRFAGGESPQPNRVYVSIAPSCGHRERTVPAAKPHCSTIRNKNAGNADSISNKTQGATCCQLGPRHPRR